MPAEIMPESDPSKRNELSAQRDTDRAPAGPLRAAENGESLMTRLLRAFGLKSGTTRDELEEVLEEGAGDETGFSPEEQSLLKTSSACVSAALRMSCCRAPTSSPCSGISRSATW